MEKLFRESKKLSYIGDDLVSSIRTHNPGTSIKKESYHNLRHQLEVLICGYQNLLKELEEDKL